MDRINNHELKHSEVFITKNPRNSYHATLRIRHLKAHLKQYRENEKIFAENEKVFQEIEDDNRELIRALAGDCSNMMLELDERKQESKQLVWRNKKLSEKSAAKDEEICRLKRLCKEQGVKYKRKVKEDKL